MPPVPPQLSSITKVRTDSGLCKLCSNSLTKPPYQGEKLQTNVILLNDEQYSTNMVLLSQTYRGMEGKLKDPEKEARVAGLKIKALKTKLMKI